MESKAVPYRWVVMITWMAAHVWAFTTLESLGILLPGIRVELGLSPIQEGWLGSSALIGPLFLAIPSGWLLSRYNPKRLTSITVFVGTLFIFMQGWAPIFALLLVGRFFFGLTLVAREPARALLLKQWVPPREIVVVNALMNFLWAIAAVGIILTPLILRLLDGSWRGTFYFFGGISLALALLWQLLGKQRVTPEYATELRSQERSPIGSILKYKELWMLGIGLVGIGINFAALATFWPSYMLDNFQLSLTKSASLIGISVAVSAVAGLGVGVIVTKVGKKRVILSVCGVVLAISSVGLLWTGSYPFLVLISMANGVSWAFFPVVMTIPFELAGIKPREIAVAIGFLETAIWAGAVIGPVLAGSLQEATGDLRLALMVTSITAISLTGGALFLPRRLDELAFERGALEP